MPLIQHVLAASAACARPAAPPAGGLVVAGAGGALGSAVLAQVLAVGGAARVHALATGPIRPALRGFSALALDDLPQVLPGTLDTAVIVFDRERHANGREAAFLRPVPQQAAALAQALADAGVRRLVVVWPHAPATLPDAMRHGLASLDEHAIARLPFTQVVFVRSAQASGPGAGRRSAPARLAGWMLGQLRWMVPQRQQAVHPRRVAAFVAGIVRFLPAAPQGTRVASTERVWEAAHSGDPVQHARWWLLGGDDAADLPVRPVEPRAG